MKKCPYCSSKLLENKSKCTFCGKTLDSNIDQTSISQTQPIEINIKRGIKTRLNFTNVLIIFALMLAGLIAVLLIISSIMKTNKIDVPSGEEVSLYYGGIELLCGRTKEDYSELIGYLVKKDNYGFNQMLQAGRAFTVPSGTSALVLEHTLSQTKVRILEGLHKDEIAWVGREATQK